MKTLDITWLKSTTANAAQIYSSGLQYCLANAKHEQCHPFVFCKDFIQDAVHGHLHKHKASIYGFTYDPATMPALSLDRVRILLTNSADAKFGDRIPGAIDMINQVEKRMKLKKSYVWKVGNPPKTHAKNGVYYLSGSGMWLNSPVLVSMYSLILRVGFCHTKGANFMDTLKGVSSGKIKQYQSNDQSQITQAIKGIERILDKGYRRFFYIDTQMNYPPGVDIGTMHNNSGIVSFSHGNTASVCKHWTRKSIDKPRPAKTDEAVVTTEG